jgi:hypothetical protein
MFGRRKRETYEVLDLPELSRRGLVQLDAVERRSNEFVALPTTRRVVESEETTSSPSSNSALTSPATSVPSNDFDFLSTLAGAGQSNVSSSTPSTLSSPSPIDEKDISSVKNMTWRVENVEYKIEQLLERICELERTIATLGR